MNEEASGEYISLVARLHQDADRRWLVSVVGPAGTEAFALVPATFVARLWRPHDGGPLRGIVQLAGTEFSAPIQSNGQLVALIQAWLRTGAAPEA